MSTKRQPQPRPPITFCTNLLTKAGIRYGVGTQAVEGAHHGVVLHRPLGRHKGSNRGIDAGRGHRGGRVSQPHAVGAAHRKRGSREGRRGRLPVGISQRIRAGHYQGVGRQNNHLQAVTYLLRQHPDSGRGRGLGRQLQLHGGGGAPAGSRLAGCSQVKGLRATGHKHG